MAATVASLFTFVAVFSAVTAAAQEGGRFPPPVGEIVKEVVCDPTTYAPASISFVAMHLDWTSSQVLFRNGFLEQNACYTASGLPNAVAMSYGAGNRRVLTDALQNLGLSLAHNAVDRLVERALAERYPNHRKLIRVVGWIERIAFASCMSYYLSVGHFRQWRANERLVRELGYR